MRCPLTHLQRHPLNLFSPSSASLSQILRAASHRAEEFDSLGAHSQKHDRLYQRSLAAGLLDGWRAEMAAARVRLTPQMLTSLVSAYGHAGQPHAVLDLMEEAFGAGDRGQVPSLFELTSSSSSGDSGSSGSGSSRERGSGGAGPPAQSSRQAAGSGSGSSGSGVESREHEAGAGTSGDSAPEGAAVAAAAAGGREGSASGAAPAFKPDLRTFNAAVAACTRVGHLGEAAQLLRDMKVRGSAFLVWMSRTS